MSITHRSTKWVAIPTAILFTLAMSDPGFAQRGGGGRGGGGGGGGARSGGGGSSASRPSTSSRPAPSGGSVRQSRTASTPSRPTTSSAASRPTTTQSRPAGQATGGAQRPAASQQTSAQRSGTRSGAQATSTSSGRDVETGTVGETKVAKGEDGWVAANENGVAAGNGSGEGGAVNREGESASWESGDWEGEDIEGGNIEGWEDDDVFEDVEAWEVMAGTAAVMAIGTMIASPPPSHTTVVVQSSSYEYADGVWYEPQYQGTEVVYEVVAAPVGAVISGLPDGCEVRDVGGVQHHVCGGNWYVKSSKGYTVVAPQ